MKSKRVLWSNNSILYAEHINKLTDLIENGYTQLYQNILRNNYGFWDYSVDEIALSSGILSINYAKGYFSDGTLFEYDSKESNYPLFIDLNSFSEELFYSAKKFYIVRDKDSLEESKNIVSTSEEIIPISYQLIKLKIIDNPINLAIPIAEIFIKGGAFNLKDFFPPSCFIKKNSILGIEISKIIVFLRKSVLGLKSQLEIKEDPKIELTMLLKDINESLVLMNYIYINEMSPFDLYTTLCQCIGKLSWHSFLMPNLPIYNHQDSFFINQKLILLLNEIITASRTGYDRLEFTSQNDLFKLLIPNKVLEEIFLIIEPNNEDSKQWIQNTIICSESYFEEFETRRFPGIPREIFDENGNELIVKLDKFSNYLQIGQNLCVFTGNSKINKISLYYKESI